MATGYARRRCVGGHTLGERVEVGVGTRAFDAHDFVECARAREGAPPRVHVRGRVGDVHGFVASGDAGEDVDLAADFRADEAGGQADAPLVVAGEGDLREESARMRSPVGAVEGALVGATPRQAHDVDATAHRPRTRAGGQADVSGQDDARDAVFRHGGGGQRARRVDDEASRFDVDVCAVSADVEDAVGLACGFVAGPGDPRVDAEARERLLFVNILGRQVGDARARVDGRGGDGIDGLGQALVAWCAEHEGGSDARVTQSSLSGVPVKIEQSGVGHVQCRKARTGHEARVGRANSGSGQMVVAVVVVVDDSTAECVVSCARVVVGAVGAFRGEATFAGSRTDSARSARVTASPVARVFASSAVLRGGAQSLATRMRSWSSVRLPGVGVFALVALVSTVRSRRLARVRASGGERLCDGRGRGKCRHCLPFQSTTLQLLYKREV